MFAEPYQHWSVEISDSLLFPVPRFHSSTMTEPYQHCGVEIIPAKPLFSFSGSWLSRSLAHASK